MRKKSWESSGESRAHRGGKIGINSGSRIPRKDKVFPYNKIKVGKGSLGISGGSERYPGAGIPVSGSSGAGKGLRGGKSPQIPQDWEFRRMGMVEPGISSGICPFPSNLEVFSPGSAPSQKFRCFPQKPALPSRAAPS